MSGKHFDASKEVRSEGVVGWGSMSVRFLVFVFLGAVGSPRAAMAL